jgi:indolepyruvate ferredoxin oxidoreductase alpha subunit
VPNAGELTPEIVIKVLDDAMGIRYEKKDEPIKQPRKPSLCAGCGHRSAFYAIKRALPKGIYTSDIGCYTLGLNLGGVDTCLCMGAALSQAAGFYHAFKDSPKPPPIAAVIGDSTYFHAGIPPTINALITGARFVLVILDNATTAMTGHQPTPATGHVTNDYTGRTLQLEQVLKGCGIETVFVQDPYDVTALIETTKEAYRLSEDQGVVAIIARHPCIRDKNAMKAQPAYKIRITQECNACGYCAREFECPAIEVGQDSAVIDRTLCIECGVCVDICPRKAIVAEGRK